MTRRKPPIEVEGDDHDPISLLSSPSSGSRRSSSREHYGNSGKYSSPTKTTDSEPYTPPKMRIFSLSPSPEIVPPKSNFVSSQENILDESLDSRLRLIEELPETDIVHGIKLELEQNEEEEELQGAVKFPVRRIESAVEDKLRIHKPSQIPVSKKRRRHTEYPRKSSPTPQDDPATPTWTAKHWKRLERLIAPLNLYESRPTEPPKLPAYIIHEFNDIFPEKELEERALAIARTKYAKKRRITM